MSDLTTTARPYAKAIFEHALAENKLVEWSDYLLNLAQAVLVPDVTQFINNPSATTEQQIELLLAVSNSNAAENTALDNFISLLAGNKRLLLLPKIKELYELYKSEQEKTLVVDVISFSTLSAEQEKKLVESLSTKLQRTISLHVSVDPSVLGGALIQAGDLVIDGTVRGKLHKLANELAA